MKKQSSHDTTTSFLDAVSSTEPASDKKKSNPSKETQYTVVKRNGTLVPFRRDRIFKAIEAAFRDTKKMAEGAPLDAELQAVIDQITGSVVKQVLNLASKGACLNVEGIQDVVEVTLMKHGYHDVARDYIIYRDSRKMDREGARGNLKIYRRDKTTPTRFNPMKIASAIERAFRRAQKIEEQSPDYVVEAVNALTKKIVDEMVELSLQGETLYIDMVEDRIERELMAEKYFDVAKNYILHRAEEAAQSEPSLTLGDENTSNRQFDILGTDGKTVTITERQLQKKLAFACKGLESLVSVGELLESSLAQFYIGIKEQEVDLAYIMSARSKIEKEPAYSQVAARLLLDTIYRETMGLSASDSSLKKAHQKYFKKYVKEAISLQRVSPDLLHFDLDELSLAIDLSRDDLFTYLGLQTLYDRYFLHHEQRRLETPQIFWMRVAMGLALKEGEQKNQRAIEFYNVLSQFHFTSSTPTLFNSGTLHSQLSSCYLSTVMDDLHHIFKVVADDAQLSKWAGGIGNDWTNVRATGARIKGTNGTSQGVIPFLKVANDTAVAVNQCFAPDTLIYTDKGLKPISKIQIGDLVLGISGIYREVLEKFAYNQKGAMVRLQVKDSIEPIAVTSGHPFYAIRKDQKMWVEAGDLEVGDLVAQVIPKEFVHVEGFDENDARFYGLFLASGNINAQEEWSLSCNHSEDFIQNYLLERGIEFSRRENTWKIHQSLIADATTGNSIGSYSSHLPFGKEDVYGSDEKKHISPRFSHLPRPQAWALVQGLLGESSTQIRNETIHWTHSSRSLAEDLRYQMLRQGVPTSGKKGKNGYRLEIPAVEELTKSNQGIQKNWLISDGHLFTKLVKKDPIAAVPFVYDLKVEGDESYMTASALAHNGGKRKGAMCAYLETWHLDIEDFLELRKNTGDERRRTHDMNTANWIPDLFIKRVRENGFWTLFSPNDAPDLHDLYGTAFEKRYKEYEAMTETGQIKLFKRMEALQLWRKMLSMLFETGHPWITFKDPSNIRSPQDHKGVVHSSNLCTEILLNTSADETAVCNLGSINLAKHVTKNGLDEKLLAQTVRTAVRMLDNVIDINFYPIVEAKNSNLQHRPIGLGLMGFQDALYLQNISYASHAAVAFADKSMEMISYYAILASTELAAERGAYPSYRGSKWDRGFLPLDTINLLDAERGIRVDVDRSQSMDWQIVRDAVAKHGMRNSNTMAIAPTATIANITGSIPSIEPMYKHLFVKSNLSGEFTIVNPHLVERLKKENLWDDEMIDDLKYFDGSIREIERIPEEVKQLFLTSFEIEPEWIIECAARRQKWIDMGQSLNLYLSEPSGKKLHQMYMLGWEKGLKTQYYCRTLGATQIEKSSIDINKRGLQPRWMKSKSASSNIKVDRQSAPTVCTLGEACESCQ